MKRWSVRVTSTRPVGSIEAGTGTTRPAGTVGGVVAGGRVGGVMVVGAVVVDPACESPPDPLLHAPQTATIPNASSAQRVRNGFGDRETIKPLNLPPRGALIVRLLRQ